MAQMLAVNVAEWKMPVRISWGEWREESSFGNDEIGEWGGGGGGGPALFKGQ